MNNRKKDTFQEINRVLKKDEIWITENVNNILFRKK